MARKRMVTRTIKSTKVECLCIDLKSNETFNATINLSSTFKDNTKLVEKLREKIDTEEVKFVTIVEQEEVEKLYGLSEDDFLKYGKELDSETRKEIETEKE